MRTPLARSRSRCKVHDPMFPTMLKTAVLAGALALAGAPALSASAGALSPVGLSVSPAVVLVATGQHSYSETITIINTGTDVLAVAAHPALTAHAANGTCAAPTDPTWATLTPASFRLVPGQMAHARFAATAPASMTGAADLAASFAAEPAVHVAGAASMAGVVNSRMVLRLTGITTRAPACVASKYTAPKGPVTTTPKAGGPLAIVEHPASHIGELATGVGALALVGLGSWYLIRRRRTA